MSTLLNNEQAKKMYESAISDARECERIAKFYKKISDKTENRGGIFKLVNQFAKHMNKKYYYLGITIIALQLGILAEDIDKDVADLFKD